MQTEHKYGTEMQNKTNKKHKMTGRDKKQQHTHSATTYTEPNNLLYRKTNKTDLTCALQVEKMKETSLIMDSTKMQWCALLGESLRHTIPAQAASTRPLSEREGGREKENTACG